MKKGIVIMTGILAVLLVFGMVSCGGGGNTPTAIAKKFFTSLEKGDTKTLLGLVTPEVGQNLAPYTEKAKGSFMAVGGIKGIAKWEEEIDGDEAIVRPVFKDENARGDYLVTEISFEKIDGKWKITDLD
jgi:hypothetical protein